MLMTYLALCCVTARGECLAWLGNVEQRWSAALVLFWHALRRGEALSGASQRKGHQKDLEEFAEEL